MFNFIKLVQVFQCQTCLMKVLAMREFCVFIVKSRTSLAEMLTSVFVFALQVDGDFRDKWRPIKSIGIVIVAVAITPTEHFEHYYGDADDQ